MIEKNIPTCSSCSVGECPISKYCSIDTQHQTDLYKTVVHYRKGQLIIKEDTEAFAIQILHQGKAIITSDTESNKRLIIRLAKEGDILEYIQNGSTLMYPFSAEAIDDCKVCVIPKNYLLQILRDDINLTYHLEKRYAHKFIETEKRLKDCMTMNSRAKLVYALLLVSEAFDGKVPLLRKELGEMIGISAEQVSREITKLAREGYIALTPKHNEIVIKDKPGLKEVLDVTGPR